MTPLALALIAAGTLLAAEKAPNNSATGNAVGYIVAGVGLLALGGAIARRPPR